MLKQIIKEIVNTAQGLNGVDVAVQVVIQVEETACIDIDGTSISEALDQLAKDGEIVEIEYTLPSMPGRIKSFYLPKRTHVMVRAR